MVSLTYSIAFRNDNTVGTLHRSTHVSLQFRTMHLTILMDGVDLAVVIEEHTEVIDISLHVMMFPRTFYLLTGVALQALPIDIGKDIELSVGIADSWRPDTLTIDFLVILQRELVVGEIETVEAVGDILPVD